MPLPTLLTKGAIKVPSGETQADADKVRAIDYVTTWLSKRVIGGVSNPTRPPTKLGDKILLLESKTGSGKSTILPPELYIAFGMRKSVAVTQPRVISAVQTPQDILKYYSSEFKIEENIGYQTGSISKRTRRGLIFMTIGVLYQQLKTLEDEALIRKYKFIIIDEVHERSIDLDLTLSLLKLFLGRNWKNPDCPFVILTSATFDIEGLRIYFNTPKSHIIKVAGARAYPIEEHFLDVDVDNYVTKSIEMVLDIHEKNGDDYKFFLDEIKRGRPPAKSPSVDILVFVSGVGDMDNIITEINKKSKDMEYPIIGLKLNSKIYGSAGIEYKSILTIPLHKLKTDDGRMPVRRVIVSTDVAQTSVTIETLKYCIDAGVRNFVSWNPDYNANVSLITQISKASATQRKGRVGRVTPGQWYPCYTKETYESLIDNPYPDIITSNMSSGLLTIIVLSESLNIKDLDFINNIPTSSLMSSLEELYLIGAVKYDGGSVIPTTIGNIINKFPIIPPTYGRLILGAYEHNINVTLMVTLACILQVGDKIFKAKYKLQDIIPELEQQYIVHMDDFIDYLLLFQNFTDYVNNVYVKTGDKKGVSINSINEWAQKIGLNIGKEFMEAIELRDRIILSMYESKLQFNAEYPDRIVMPSVSLDGFNEQVIGIKRCISDAFPHYRLNYSGCGKLYKSHYKGINISINSNIIKYLYSRDPDAMPKVIYCTGFNFGKNKFGDKYVFSNKGPVSVVDGFIQVDDTYGLI